MPNFRRYFVAGGTYFFTVVTHQRNGFLCTQAARSLLRRVVRDCRARWPFTIDAVVVLPDHLHVIWTLPAGDAAYSKRWAWIKKEFTKSWLAAGHLEQPQTAGRRRDRRRGVWQAKFWEHTIADESDLEQHFDYIHYNPVKHGLAHSPAEWRWSSFQRWVQLGMYPAEWGRSSIPSGQLDFRDIEDRCGE